MSDRNLDDIIGAAVVKNRELATIFIALENAVLVLAMVVTLISFYTIVKHKKFHSNLRILFINQFIANISFIVVRLVSLFLNIA